MIHLVTRTAFVVGWVLCAAGVAQEQTEVLSPHVRIEPEYDGTYWVELALPRTPDDTAAVSRALATSLGETDPDVVEDLYDGNYDDDLVYWSGYCYDAMGRRAFTYQGEMALESLRQHLLSLGYTRLDITVYNLPLYESQLTWGGHVLAHGESRVDYQWVTLSLESAWSPMTLTLQRPAISIIGHYLPIPILVTFTLLLLLLLRQRSLARPAEEAGFACYLCTQGNLFLASFFWVAVPICLNRWDPLEPLAYSEGWLAEVHHVLVIVLWVLLGISMTIFSRVFLLPVYLRIPGATWTRRDFAVQAAWFGALAATVGLTTPLILTHLHQGAIPLVALLFIAALLGVIFYIRILFSLGLVVQSLDEGELRERAVAMAKAGALPKLWGVYMVYRPRSPVLNAFAANKMRLLFTEELICHLTRREVDSIIGHELTHMGKNHPVKLQRGRFLHILLGIVVAGGACIVTIIGLAFVLPYEVMNALLPIILLCLFLPGGLLGMLLSSRLSRRYEFEADAGALSITGDPEALISALIKLTRLNYMPLEWGGRWMNLFLTHPSTAVRIERIRELGGVSTERLEELKAGCSIGEGHYEIPRSAGPHRVFTAIQKTRVQLLNSLLFILVSPLIPGIFAWVAHEYVAIPSPLLLGVMLAGSVLSLIAFQNIAAMQGFRTLADRFREYALGTSITESTADFVTFTPNDEIRLYDGFLNWDVGLVETAEDGLRYVGDGTSFTIPRGWIHEITLVRRNLSVVPGLNVHVHLRAPEGVNVPQIVRFGGADAGSLTEANRLTRRLFERLQSWQRATPPNMPMTPTEHSLPLSPLVDVGGIALGDVFKPAQSFVLAVLATFSGVALGVALGLPTTAPSVTSAITVGLLSGLGALLVQIPTWMAGRKAKYSSAQ